MLADSLTLTPGSIVLNSLIEKGTMLPDTNLRSGRIFYLTHEYDTFTVGAYVCTGAAWIGLASGGTSTPAPTVVKYDIGLFCGGKVEIGNAILASFLAPRTVYMEANLPESVAKCKIPPLATTVYVINVDDVASGTVTFAPGSSVGTIAFQYSMLITAGQTIELQAPSTTDTAISDVGITIVANVNVASGVIGA